MKNLIILLMLLLFGTLQTTDNQASKTVYICTGGKSVCYHSTPNCKGLRNCSREIKEITLEDAQKMNRRPCKMCCK